MLHPNLEFYHRNKKRQNGRSQSMEPQSSFATSETEVTTVPSCQESESRLFVVSETTQDFRL